MSRRGQDEYCWVKHIFIHNGLSWALCITVCSLLTHQAKTSKFTFQAGTFIIQTLCMTCCSAACGIFCIRFHSIFEIVTVRLPLGQKPYPSGCRVLISQNGLHLSLLSEVWEHMIINLISHLEIRLWNGIMEIMESHGWGVKALSLSSQGRLHIETQIILNSVSMEVPGGALSRAIRHSSGAAFVHSPGDWSLVLMPQ